MKLSFEQILAAPPDRVFAVLSDPRRRPEWQSSLKRVEVQTPGEPGLGTRWREWLHGGPAFDLEISAFEPTTRWAEQTQGRLGSATLELQFRPSEEGAGRTRLTVNLELRPSNLLGRLITPLPRLAQPMLRSDLRRAARIAAAEAGSDRR